MSGPGDGEIPRLGGVSADEDGDPADAPDATLVQVPADRERLFGGAHGESASTDALQGLGAMGAEDGTLLQRPSTVPFMQPLPAAGRPAYPAYPAYASPPQAPSSDRVLLPPQGEPARAAAVTGRAPIPPWVLVYLFGALLLALAGGIILLVEARILGHF